MCQAAINAGAHGAFLSGAGPTILAICSGATGGDIFTQTREERQENGVANAMRRAVDSLSTKHDQWKGGKFYICSPCYQGCHVVSADPPMSDAMATFGTLDGDL
jgi:homoserine kinase